MRYVALATDYDGTLAHHGRVDDQTVEALRRLAATGRKLLLVTGRQIDDLSQVFPHLELFDRVVGENGALVYRPRAASLRLLAERPAASFIEALREQGVSPLFVGHVVVATVEPNETTALEVIRQLGLELEVIFNKGSVMILPTGVNKASGLEAALEELQLSPGNIVAIGDAENDHAFLKASGFGVAVANALDAVKADADYVTEGRASDGVRELIAQLIGDDLASVERHRGHRSSAVGR
jgi:phosphoglycolate phosphatase (TIGR01487 family)